MTNRDFKFASFFERLAARLIDFIVVTFIAWPLSLVLIDKEQSAFNYKNYSSLQTGFGFLIFYLFYYPIFEATGGTPGKRVLSIKTVSINTLRPISFGQAYKRSFLLSWAMWFIIILFMTSDFANFYPEKSVYFLMIMFTLFAIIGPLAVLWSKRKQGWHDSWANTAVISINKSKEHNLEQTKEAEQIA